MDDSSFFDGSLDAHESSAFALVCNVHGFRPEQFQVGVVDVVECAGTASVVERVFVITQRSSGLQRRYRADHLSKGLGAFECDLRAGVFPWGSVDWDWIGARRAARSEAIAGSAA